MYFHQQKSEKEILEWGYIRGRGSKPLNNRKTTGKTSMFVQQVESIIPSNKILHFFYIYLINVSRSSLQNNIKSYKKNN